MLKNQVYSSYSAFTSFSTLSSTPLSRYILCTNPLKLNLIILPAITGNIYDTCDKGAPSPFIP